MCGIVAAISSRSVVDRIAAGLIRLEYRGYDSVGVCIQDSQSKHQIVKRVGKVKAVVPEFKSSPLLKGTTGIGHTRWATHGAVTELNAHPHISGPVAVVHNGVIENHRALKSQLITEGRCFLSDTDTEVIAHLIAREISQGMSLLDAVATTLRQLEGSFALAVMSESEPGIVVGARRGGPLAIAFGGKNGNEEGMFLISDVIAAGDFADRCIYLENGDLVQLRDGSFSIWDSYLNQVERQIVLIDTDLVNPSKGTFRHFMAKELHEAPDVAQSLIAKFSVEGKFTLPGDIAAMVEVFPRVQQIEIVACGGSRHAATYGETIIQELAGIRVSVSVASEFRYIRHSPRDRSDTLFVTISQSGETADTVAALELAKSMGYLGSLAVCNVRSSSLARMSDWVLGIGAGVEIGVASTKALTNQMICMVLLGLAFRGGESHIWNELKGLPNHILGIQRLLPDIKLLAKETIGRSSVFFLGRGQDLPVAMEAALKFKEITYKFSEAYPAGELKHGPLALIDDTVCVIAISTDADLASKTHTNLEESRLRGAVTFLVTDDPAAVIDDCGVLLIPRSHRALTPIVACSAVQFLAYEAALLMGTDADQPRNLAKSVTVE